MLAFVEIREQGVAADGANLENVIAKQGADAARGRKRRRGLVKARHDDSIGSPGQRAVDGDVAQASDPIRPRHRRLAVGQNPEVIEAYPGDAEPRRDLVRPWLDVANRQVRTKVAQSRQDLA